MGLLLHIGFPLIERVCREIETHEVALPEELLFIGDFGWGLDDFWLWNFTGCTEGPEEVELAASTIFLSFGAVSLNSFEIIEEITTATELIEGASFNGRFPRLLIELG